LIHTHHGYNIKLLAFCTVESYQVEVIGRTTLVAKCSDGHRFKLSVGLRCFDQLLQRFDVIGKRLFSYESLVKARLFKLFKPCSRGRVVLTMIE
jgi:hypothetical protein